ncbi:MAG: glycoside hydrolase family 1 protein [Anaerolineales bacterium]
MIEASLHFPPGFLWGTATSSHQVEGNNKGNDWWDWEQHPGHISEGDRSGLACDWWGGRWAEDLDRAAEGAQNTHRLSVEWSRIEPRPGIWDEQALAQYREIVAGMAQRSLRPMVTLHHFTNPRWLAEQGGWENEEVILRFEAFARKVAAALAGQVDLWCTLNEPNVYVFEAYLEGLFPPGKQDPGAAFRVMGNMVRAHARAYRAIHELAPGSQVGVAHHFRGIQPDSASPLDHLVARLQSRLFNEAFPRALWSGRLPLLLGEQAIPEARGTQDFFGLNYYTTDRVAFDLRRPGEFFGRRFFPPRAELSPGGFIANVPDGFSAALRWASRFGLPVLVTENGVEDGEDRLRPKYLCQHLQKLWQALNSNFPIRGYWHWTLVDNFEWERGWTQRFGLWALNPQTQQRTARPSAQLYAQICRQNCLSSSMVASFAPAALPILFPG